jgi:uncharacterized protein (DUF2336 family)
MQPDGVVADTHGERGATEMQELARLADSLVEQLAETRQHYEQLRTDLDNYEARATTAVDDGPAEEQAETPEENHERVRLFALNLALSGESREEVSAQLHDQFGVDDASEILDAVFPESTGRQRKRRFGRRKGS